ncbi:MAG: S41 family peptidase [Prevotellaceae bacterium]|jgi:hypothetical protein|nr:S41 family peptidase [Prevotellaceae bacterium]
MYEDFDEFYSIMADVNPQLTVRYKVTGINILDSIKKMRTNIDTITNEVSFAELIYKSIKMCNDLHCNLIEDEKLLLHFHKDSIITNNIIDLITKTEQKIFQQKTRLRLILSYDSGSYYNIGKFNIIFENRRDSLPSGAEILSINGNSIDFWLSDKNLIREYRWDNKLQKKYCQIRGNLYIDKNDTICIKYKNHNKIDSIFYLVKKTGISVFGGAYVFNSVDEIGYVNFFDNEKILYIRLPKMLSDNYPFVDSIIAKGTGKSIKKVIIDIRRNGGGGDDVWMNILSAIIKDTIRFDAPIGLRCTEASKIAMQKNNRWEEWDSLKSSPIEIAMLNNEKFTTVNWGEPIAPNGKSLNYTGKIYVLQDRMIFSSAGSLSNIAYLCENIVSVGENTGRLLGFGINPLLFALPNSHLTFSMEPVIELTNKGNSNWEYFHDNVEIYIPTTIEQTIKNFNAEPMDNGTIYTKDYLFNEDSVFQKVLQLE